MGVGSGDESWWWDVGLRGGCAGEESDGSSGRARRGVGEGVEEGGA